MKYLCAVHREGAEGTEEWAPAGEPVISNFPTGARNTFLGATSFKPVPYAEVVELDVDIDVLAEGLKDRFRCLPTSMLDKYILEIAVLAHKLPVGTLCQPLMDDDGEAVKVMVVESGEIYVLWEKQPIPESYR